MQISLKPVLLTDTGLLYVYKGTPVSVQNHTWKNCSFCFITPIAWGKLVAAHSLFKHISFSLAFYFPLSYMIYYKLWHQLVVTLAIQKLVTSIYT